MFSLPCLFFSEVLKVPAKIFDSVEMDDWAYGSTLHPDVFQGPEFFSTSPSVQWRDMDSCKVKSGISLVPQILVQLFYHCALLLRKPSTDLVISSYIYTYKSLAFSSPILLHLYVQVTWEKSPHSQGASPLTTVSETRGRDLFWFCDITTLWSFQVDSCQTVDILFVCFEQCDVVRQISQRSSPPVNFVTG